MKIACVQMNCQFGEVKANLQKAADLIEPIQADLFVLPELFNTGYVFQSHEEINRLAEPADGNTAQFLKQLALEKQTRIVAGIAEKRNSNIYNACLLVGPGLHSVYRKIHLFDTEKLWFTPGDQPFFVVDAGIAKLGMMICFDWIFPESMRTLALKGADIVCHPSNLVLPYCQQAMITRCLENNVFAITANRIGAERRDHAEAQFTGQSQITGPRGQVLASAGELEETVLVAEIDIEAARNKQLNSRNDLFNDRHPEFYAL